MARYFITLQYDGSRYHGWQIQPNGITVEGEIEIALSTILRQNIDIVGAGRTDAGVHASMMVAHFDFTPTLPNQLKYKINKLLPKDIAINDIKKVNEDMHARFSATSRTYHYYIHTHKNPFLNNTSYLLTYPLNIGLMNEAAKKLFDYQDFGAFCKSHTDVKTTLCTITEARWETLDDGTRYRFVITANRFLRNMVRAIVGTLIEVGRGKMTLNEFSQVIEGKSRSDAGESMPAHALILTNIKY